MGAGTQAALRLIRESYLPDSMGVQNTGFSGPAPGQSLPNQLVPSYYVACASCG